jgi:uncharacterized protein
VFHKSDLVLTTVSASNNSSKIPLRTCMGCREQKPKRQLVRIVRTPEGSVIVDDPKGKANGRGAYICADVACFEKALKKKAFAHVLKVSIPPETLDAIKDDFIKRLLG